MKRIQCNNKSWDVWRMSWWTCQTQNTKACGEPTTIRSQNAKEPWQIGLYQYVLLPTHAKSTATSNSWYQFSFNCTPTTFCFSQVLVSIVCTWLKRSVLHHLWRHCLWVVGRASKTCWSHFGHAGPISKPGDTNPNRKRYQVFFTKQVLLRTWLNMIMFCHLPLIAMFNHDCIMFNDDATASVEVNNIGD